jgi:hypothetical protein
MAAANQPFPKIIMRLTSPVRRFRARLFATGVALSLACALVLRGQEQPAPESPPATPAKTEPADPQPTEAPGKLPAATPRASELPWVKKKTIEPLPVLRPPSGVREILEKYDLAESQLAGFFNGEPLTPGQEDVLVRILFRLPRIGYESIHKWRKPDLQLDQLMADTPAHRLEVIPLQGRLLGVEQREVAPELAQRLEIKHYYLARISLTDLGYEAVVAVRRIPAHWLVAPDLNEPVSLDGIYLKVLDQTADPPQLLFVSRRIHWLPDRPVPEMNIGPDQLRLAALGLDLTLLEDLKQSNRRELGDLDREPQYQLLDLVGRTPAAKFVADPPKEIDVVALLQAPEKHQGELVSVYGFAQRITKIMVQDPDIRARFGITHYYEIDVGVNLGDKTIHFVDDAKGKGKKKAPAGAEEKPGESAAEKPAAEKTTSKKAVPTGPIFNNDYPVTVCVRELAPGLEPADSMRDLVHIDGIFMKTWAYRNAKMAQFENKLQVAPLVIGKVAQRVVPAKVYNWVSDVLVGFAIAATALIIGSVIWWFRAGAGDRESEARAKEAATPSFAGLEKAPTKPDFSGMDKAEPKVGSGPDR